MAVIRLLLVQSKLFDVLLRQMKENGAAHKPGASILLTPCLEHLTFAYPEALLLFITSWIKNTL